uniref:Secreted protein n=1 Tax=Angiostrongylus costaricensis TaxID=334426 RepID=A0A0R3PNF3_ANGCS
LVLFIRHESELLLFYRLLEVVLLAIKVCLVCLEGSDCEKEASCDECSGVACTRITSFNLEDNREVALTCIPYDTRSALKGLYNTTNSFFSFILEENRSGATILKKLLEHAFSSFIVFVRTTSNRN